MITAPFFGRNVARLQFSLNRQVEMTLPRDPSSSSGTIRVERYGEESLLSIQQFEALVGVAFVPQLDFANFSVFQDIVQRVQTLHGKGELTREQQWLGNYYKRELLVPLSPEVVVRWIDDSIGWGIFTAKSFKKMEFVVEYCGKVRKRVREDRKNAYCFEYVAAPHRPTPYTIDAQDQGGIGRFINHSNHPNLRPLLATLDWVNHVVLVAEKPISAGEQLFYDYGPDYWSSRSKPKNLTL